MNKSNWISLIEKYPDKNSWVYVCVKDYNCMPEPLYTMANAFYDGEYWFLNKRTTIMEKGMKITHWMNLPDLPDFNL